MLEHLENIETAITNLDTNQTQIGFSDDDYYVFAHIANQLERIADALEKTKEEA